MTGKQKRTFLYEPYGETGQSVLLYFHKRPASPMNFDDSWDMTGVDVPIKEDKEWRFWRNIQDERGNDDIKHDLTKEEIKEIKKYIMEHKELVPNIYL